MLKVTLHHLHQYHHSSLTRVTSENIQQSPKLLKMLSSPFGVKKYSQSSHGLQDSCPLLLQPRELVGRLFCKPVSPRLLRIHLPAFRTSRHLKTVQVAEVQDRNRFRSKSWDNAFYFWSTLVADEMQLITAEDGN